MYLRCPSCKQSFRIGGADEDRTAICIGCGRALSLARRGRLGATCEERADRAQRYSQSQKIDLASAYSVLLGIMPLPQAKSITESSPPIPLEVAAPTPDVPAPESGEPSDADRAPGRRLSYDPGFHKAVASGKLTIRQAIERGDRVMYASRLAQEHGLTLNEAFLVADNRISVTEAMDARRKTPITSAPAAAADPRPSNRLGMGLALGFLLALGLWSTSALLRDHVSPRTAARASVATGAAARALAIDPETEVRRNPVGEPTLIQGRDPDRVLEAFCRSARGVLRTPLRVVGANEGDGVGILRQNGALYSVPIRKDDAGDRWVIGNGREPIVPVAGTRG